MANYNDMDDSSEDVDSWISQFCSIFGHNYFVEVAPEFIEDDFNLTGLSSIVPYYKQALDVILDLEPETPIQPNDLPIIEHAAELLYGLIHSRFIITKQGLHLMAEKFDDNCFGSCPRYYCDRMRLIPIGRFDSPGIETVRLYCPNCNDIYLPSSSRYLNIDGAFFGTSFPGLFMKMFPDIKNQTNKCPKNQFQLKLFGFRVNSSAPCGPRMKWLRAWPNDEESLREYDACEFEIPNIGDDKISEVNSNEDNNSDTDRMDESNHEKIETENSRKNSNNNQSAGESMMSII